MLSHEQIEHFYNSFGKKQDLQFYENAAIIRLIQNSEPDNATCIYEFGCGTGKLAKLLLDKYLRDDCQYAGVDISSTMTDLCRTRLETYSARARCARVNLLIEDYPASCQVDRFISTYVLDLLSDTDAKTILEKAYNMLRPGGLLCVAGLTYGTTFVSRFLANSWNTLYKLRPQLVGGCRPVCISEKLSKHKWSITYLRTAVSYGVPSEVLVAKKIA